jgi:hypothetical protein
MMRCCLLRSRDSNNWRRRSTTTFAWFILIRCISRQGSGSFTLHTWHRHNNQLSQFLLWLFEVKTGILQGLEDLENLERP